MRKISRESSRISLVELPPTDDGEVTIGVDSREIGRNISHNVYSHFRLPARAVHTLHGVLSREGWQNVDVVVPHLLGRPGVNSQEWRGLIESDAVMMSSITATSKQTRTLINRIHDVDPNKPILIGGFDPTFRPEFYLDGNENTYVIKGEGEVTLPEMMDRFEEGAREMEDIRGLVFTRNGEIVETEPRKFISGGELSELPLPVYTPEVARMIRIATLETSRGCPNSCEFCGIMQFYGEKKYRAKSVDRIIEEYDMLKDIGRAIFYTADNFLEMPKQLEVLDAIGERGYTKPGIAQVTAVSSRKPGVIDGLRRAGIEVLCVGIESFNDESLEFLGKPYNANQNREGLSLYQEAGQNILGMMMPGGDGDTRESLRGELEAARQYCTSVQLFPPGPLPGTPLRTRIEAEGRLLRPTEDEKWELYNGHFVLFRPKNFTPYELQLTINQMHSDFYDRGPDADKMSPSQRLIYKSVKKGITKVIESDQMRKHMEFLKSVS